MDGTALILIIVATVVATKLISLTTVFHTRELLQMWRPKKLKKL